MSLGPTASVERGDIQVGSWAIQPPTVLDRAGRDDHTKDSPEEVTGPQEPRGLEEAGLGCPSCSHTRSADPLSHGNDLAN